MIRPILGDPGADSQGERQILKTGEIGARESLQDGREQPLGGYF